jgi:hypothetical protein
VFSWRLAYLVVSGPQGEPICSKPTLDTGADAMIKTTKDPSGTLICYWSMSRDGVEQDDGSRVEVWDSNESKLVGTAMCQSQALNWTYGKGRVLGPNGKPLF